MRLGSKSFRGADYPRLEEELSAAHRTIKDLESRIADAQRRLSGEWDGY